jgi:hypothetical protein
MANGESTARSRLDADSLTAVLREEAVARLWGEAELTLVLDGMELRRGGASEQEGLMQVKGLDGKLVNGYRSFNVLGMGAGEQRGLLYHHLFSSQQPDFQSENREIQRAIATTETALQGYTGSKTWVMDCGFDNDEVWWQIWSSAGSHVVVRLYHHERIVLWQNRQGVWQERYLDATFAHLQPLAEVETELEVRLVGQKRPKRQTVTVRLSSVPLRVYHPTDRQQSKAVWLVQAEIVNAVNEPWYLLTDWPVGDAASAVRIFIFYRRRWAVEDTFKFVKTCFGVEQVRMLAFEAIRTLVACAWVAAGFLFHLGLTLDHWQVRLLAQLGGWEQRMNRPPGKLILTRGLRRLLDLLATHAILVQYLEEYGDLPPFIKHLFASYGFSFRH